MKARIQSRNKKVGNQVEQVAIQRLRYLGVRMVDKINDSWNPIRRDPATGLWLCQKTGGQLQGDIKGILPGGQAVLCECKYRKDRLPYSALEAHQRKNLNECLELGAVPLLFWHSGAATYLLPWPLPGFKPRKSASAEQAAAFNITSRATLSHIAKSSRRLSCHAKS